jgi:hypothetical protein
MLDDTIICRTRGAFPRFQDSIFQDPLIYLNNSRFKWRDLLKPFTDHFSISGNLIENSGFVTVTEGKTKISEYTNSLENYFLFMP